MREGRGSAYVDAIDLFISRTWIWDIWFKLRTSYTVKDYHAFFRVWFIRNFFEHIAYDYHSAYKVAWCALQSGCTLKFKEFVAASTALDLFEPCPRIRQ